jgi:hypothetical protein
MESLTRLLPRILIHCGDSDEGREQSVFAAWSAVVGAGVSRVTAPVRLHNKDLIVAVSDTTWSVQLGKIKGQILFRINAALGIPTVTGLRFIVNEGKVKAAHPSPPQVQFLAPEKEALLLAGPASCITDPEIRELFLRAAGKCLDRRSQKRQEKQTN